MHAEYACRRTGACCTSGWRIPVEAQAHARLANAIGSGRLTVVRLEDTALLERADDSEAGVTAWLGMDGRGRCLFYEDTLGMCAIHRQLGEDALPMSCRQFPRVSLTDARGTSVSLSHFCPTAAGLLVDHDEALAIIEAAPPGPAGWRPEGLDASGALPPLVRPGLLHSHESFDIWERGLVALLAREEFTPAQGLACAAAAADHVRAWTPALGPLEAHVDWSLARSVDAASAAGAVGSLSTATRLWRLARSAVPHDVAAPDEPAGLEAAWGCFVASTWNDWAPVVRRYLAGRAFATWLAYQGRGLRTNVFGLAVALGVLQAEAARACAAAARDLDRRLLVDAIRVTDLLVVHLVDPRTFAARLSSVEHAAAPPASWIEWSGSVTGPGRRQRGWRIHSKS